MTRRAGAIVAALVAACSRHEPAPVGDGTRTVTSAWASTDAGAPTDAGAARDAAPSGEASDGAADSEAGTLAADPSSVEDLRAPDGGASACRVLRGPIELPIKGAVEIAARGESVDVVMNDGGRPRVLSFSAGPPPPRASAPLPAREPAAGGSVAGLSVPCAVAGARIFCPDRVGAIRAAGPGVEGDAIVASSRTGTRIAAGTLGGKRTALAYLASRQTSEGWVTEAWLAVDDKAPVRFSEDGCGATAITLRPGGAALVALMVDARAALTAMHLRSATFDEQLRLGEDLVVFVGGPGDRRTAASFAPPPTGTAWGLLPIAKDVGDFGLAIVKLEDPPHVDEPVSWSMYPNGLDPAPVAAALARGRTWVALVRPQSAKPSSPRVLELGEIGAAGAFVPYDLIPTASSLSDVTLASDDRGTLWLAWVDAAGSWVERLACK